MFHKLHWICERVSALRKGLNKSKQTKDKYIFSSKRNTVTTSLLIKVSKLLVEKKKWTPKIKRKAQKVDWISL